MKTDNRYPYTYAADYIRYLAGYNSLEMKLSRSDASNIYSGIASALNMNEKELVSKLADYYNLNKNLITNNIIKIIQKNTN